MSYDLEAQEQLSSLKAGWHQYGRSLIYLLILILLAYGAFHVWRGNRDRQIQAAAQLYEEQLQAVAAQDTDKVLRAAQDIEAKFSTTIYASMSALAAAKAAFAAHNNTVSEQQLRWVMAQSRDPAYQAIAAIRLAGILLDAFDHEAALKTLDGRFPAQFAGLVAERKADILLAQDKREEARALYQLALDQTEQNNYPERQLIQLKLDAAISGIRKQQ